MPDHQAERRDYSALASAVAQAMREELAKLTVPEQIHAEHHAYISEMVEAAKRKRERVEKIKTQVGGWAVVAILGSIGKFGIDAFLYLKEHLK